MLSENLIKKAKKNNRKAQTELYNQFSHKWYSICLRYQAMEADAQDALQNALIRIYSRLDQFDQTKGNFGAWSSKIVVNENLMLLRKNKAVFSDIQVEMYNDIRDHQESALDILSSHELTRMIQFLPDGYRTVFNMYVIEGFSHDEIAEELGISKGTSKSQLHKAKKYLREKLEILILTD